MAIRSDDITQIIKSAIDEFDSGVETRSVGTVVEVGDGIARIYGLEGALASELLEFPGGVKGMALNLEEVLTVICRLRVNKVVGSDPEVFRECMAEGFAEVVAVR